MDIPGWQCGKCSQMNPITRKRCRKCGRAHLGTEVQKLYPKPPDLRYRKQKRRKKISIRGG